MSTLKLTLSYKPFQVMKTGEKDEVFLHIGQHEFVCL